MKRAGCFIAYFLILTLALPAQCRPWLLSGERLVTPKVNGIGQLRAEIAAGENIFLVVWEQGIGHQTQICAARMDLEGKSLDSQGITLSDKEGFEPDVTAGHGLFLVVYSDLSDGSSRILSTRLTDEGTPLDNAPLRISGENAIARMPAVVSTPFGFAVTWVQATNSGQDFDLWGRVLNADGYPMAPPQKLTDAPIRVNGQDILDSNKPRSIIQNPELALLGNDVMVVWAGTLGSGRRYSVVGLRWNLTDDQKTVSARVLVQGAPRILHPVIAPFGEAFLVSWTDQLKRGFHGPRHTNLILVSGKQIRPLSLKDGKGTRIVLTPAISSGGLVAFATQSKKGKTSHFQHSPIILRQLSADGSSFGPEKVASEDGAWPALARHASGINLLVYTLVNQREHNGLLAARIVLPRDSSIHFP